MEKPSAKSKCFLADMSNFVLISLTVVLVGLMLFQCVGLCIDFYNQPVTTSIFIENLNQQKFFSTLQFCFFDQKLMNLTKAEKIFGLNKFHQAFLLNYFIFNPNNSIPVQKFETNETSLEIYLEILFGIWEKTENEIFRIAEIVFNSKNPMEFWNLNQPNNLVALRLKNQNDFNLNYSTVVGPYTTPPRFRICFDIPSAPVDDENNDSIRFDFLFSINPKFSVGSSFADFTPYRSEGKVFDFDEYTALNYVKDPAKQLRSLQNSYSLSFKKWIALDRRTQRCIKDEEVGPYSKR